MNAPAWPSPFAFALAVLATWRLCHLLAHEDGPFDAVVRVRARLGDGVFGRLMDCVYCLSLWIAMPFAVLLARDVIAGVVTWLAVSGGACVIEHLGARRASTPGDSP